MSLKLFDLVPVIDRVDLDQGTRIETIEYSVGSLYIGTNNGKLFQVKEFVLQFQHHLHISCQSKTWQRFKWMCKAGAEMATWC